MQIKMNEKMQRLSLFSEMLKGILITMNVMIERDYIWLKIYTIKCNKY